ncbi:hypothetical protein T4C_8198, partial [Trichinella pseudospiralis]
LAFPFGRVSCFAYHEKSGRQRFGQIDVVNVLVGVVFNAFPNWLRKQSTGYEVSLHQTTVVVQVGILTVIFIGYFALQMAIVIFTALESVR